jgi:hypothetical protein
VIPVKQQIKHNPPERYGDCHRAALASILELPIEEVPHFCDKTLFPDRWRDDERAWLLARGRVPITLIFDTDDVDLVFGTMAALNPDTFYLLGGTSRKGTGHSVVGLNAGIAHDPSPELSGIVAPMEDGRFWVTFFGHHITHLDRREVMR